MDWNSFALEVSGQDRTRLRDELQTRSRARLPHALDTAAASALRDELTRSAAWVRTMRQGNVERELDAETLARLSPAQLAGIEQLARQGGDGQFRFLHDAIRLLPDPVARRERGWLVDGCTEMLNSTATLDLFGELAGERVHCFRGDATRYLPGHFLTTHNDGRKHGKRVLAFVLNLSDWHIDWGGLMLFHNGEGNAKCGWTPRFNTANLFLVPQDHSVTWVTPLAQAPRLTVSGWFYAD